MWKFKSSHMSLCDIYSWKLSDSISRQMTRIHFSGEKQHNEIGAKENVINHNFY